MEASSPLPLKRVLPFLTSSKFMVTVSPVCLSRKVTVFRPASEESTSTLGLPAAISLAMARAGFCVPLCATYSPAAVTRIPINIQKPTMPTMIQTIGLIFFDCAAGLAGKLAGWFAEAAGCVPPTGFPHCAQKLLFTFAPQFVQNAIGLPLLLN